MNTHDFQHLFCKPCDPVFIDRTPSLVSLVETDELPALVASVLIGEAKVRTLGAACRLGWRELRRLPGLGRKGLEALVQTAAVHGVEVSE